MKKEEGRVLSSGNSFTLYSRDQLEITDEASKRDATPGSVARSFLVDERLGKFVDNRNSGLWQARSTDHLDFRFKAKLIDLGEATSSVARVHNH
jgi:hypothetical protein